MSVLPDNLEGEVVADNDVISLLVIHSDETTVLGNLLGQCLAPSQLRDTALEKLVSPDIVGSVELVDISLATGKNATGNRDILLVDADCVRPGIVVVRHLERLNDTTSNTRVETVEEKILRRHCYTSLKISNINIYF